jgi:hypothetical protein|tara:strand:- start:1058 stop:1408 length:351 start_codon:yes stop_codon:yes gene_type:complete
MAQYEELSIDKGTDITLQLELEDTSGNPKNLTNYTVAGKVKKTYNTSDSDATAFTAEVKAPATGGVVNLSLTNTQTGAFKAGRYVYDVEISFVDSDAQTVIERVLEGTITVTPSVT